MISFTHSETNEYSEYIARQKEKLNISKHARLVGVSYLILILIPFLWADALLLFLGRLGISAAQMLNLLSDAAVLQVVQIVVSSVMFLLPFFIVVFGTGKKLGDIISFSAPDKKLFAPFVLMGIGFCAFANIATNTVASFFSSLGFEYQSPQIETPDGVFGFLLVILSTAVTPALVEEFAMRGIVLGSLRKHGDGFAIIISAALFGLMHCNFMQIPFAFLVGLALAYSVIKTGSIWTGIAIHFINNLLSVCLDSLFVTIESVNLQSAITAIYFVICLLCFFIGFFALQHKEDTRLELDSADTVLTLKERTKIFFSHPIIIIDIIATIIFSLISM
ncbi:MAG: CPBP family intramembrane metalloprotease [Clostridia bacterium]|nr:CPBP family intramembrane metalloprotease [Clostridia bacterium]